MPYNGTSDPSLPPHVTSMDSGEREQWVNTFNGVMSNCTDGDCEGQAFAIANARATKSRLRTLPIKSPVKRLGEKRLGGWGIVFSDESSPDLEQDFFTKDSFLWDELPTVYALYDHAEGFHPAGIELGEDGTAYQKSLPPQSYIIGRVAERKKTDYGVWFEVVLDEHNEWCDHVMQLAEKGVLGFSTDSVSHLVERERRPNGTNFIKSWAIPLISLTPIPAETRTKVSVIETTGGREVAKAVEPPRVTYPQLIKQIKQKNLANRKGNPMKVNTSTIVEAYVRRNLKKVITPAVKRAYLKMVEEDPEEEIKEFGAEGEETPQENPTKMGEFGNRLSPHAEALATEFGMGQEEAFNELAKVVAAYLQSQIVDTAVSDVPVPVEEAPVAAEGSAEVELDVEPPLEEEAEDAAMNFDEEEDAYMSLDGEEDPAALEEEEDFGAATLNIKSHALKGSVILNTPVLSVKSSRSRMRQRREPETLTRFLRAVRDKDYPYLKSAHIKAVNGDPTSDYDDNARGYKALGINPDTAGGFLVPPETSNQIIELLRAKSKMMDLVQVIPMNKSDILDIPKQTGGATSYFVGENAAITESAETFGMVRLVIRKQAALVKISNELLSDSSADVDAFIRDDISKSMANKFDETLLRGTGTAAEPLGILNSDATSTPASNPTSYSDLLSVVERVEVENVDDTVEWFWILHPTAKRVLRLMKDPNNQYIWTGSDGIGQQVAGAEPDQLLGYPWISTTLGGLDGSNYPRIFFGNWKDVVVGMRKTIEIRASDEAGTAFEYDQTWIRAIMRWDVVLRHAESIETLTGVRSS